MTREQIKLLNLYSQYKYGVNFSEIVNFNFEEGMGAIGLIGGATSGTLTGLLVQAIRRKWSYSKYVSKCLKEGEKPVSKPEFVAMHKSLGYGRGALIGGTVGGLNGAITWGKFGKDIDTGINNFKRDWGLSFSNRGGGY